MTYIHTYIQVLSSLNFFIGKRAVMSLEQMSYECPGLHGPGTRQDIFIQTFAQVLERYPKLIIPLFQRRYCWTEKQFEKWWNDVHHGKRNHLGLHRWVQDFKH